MYTSRLSLTSSPTIAPQRWRNSSKDQRRNLRCRLKVIWLSIYTVCVCCICIVSLFTSFVSRSDSGESDKRLLLEFQEGESCLWEAQRRAHYKKEEYGLWFQERGRSHLNLVFTGEASFHYAMRKRYGYSLVGERVYKVVPVIEGQNISLCAAVMSGVR